METQQRVILYGDSLILAGVQASLKVSPNLEIIVLNDLSADLPQSICELQPAAVIFDLGSVQPEITLALLRQSDLLLIGVDPSSNQFLVLSSHVQPVQCVADLVRVFQQPI
ncbi:MAG TPA: hypothetical protein VFF68_10945 [Anaerolineaceae bacterium]|nr:hypothetical protein [Anaerolineaceae bacterium]